MSSESLLNGKITESQKRQIREIARTELTKGKTPTEILAMAAAVNIPPKILTREMEKLTKKDFWDPACETIFPRKFDEANKKVISVLEKYQKDPLRPRKVLALSALPGVLFLLIFLLFPREVLAFLNSGNNGNYGLAILPFLPIVIYCTSVFTLQRDLVKYSIARDQSWVYNPEKRTDRWKNLVEKFSEIFEKGNRAQNLSDEFWGDFSVKKKNTDFWTGIFEYTVKHDKNSTTYYRTIFAFRLNAPLKTRFSLKPESLVANLFRFGKEIDVESAEFNRTFAVFYNGAKMEKQLEIVKILSPSIQVRLLEMREQEGDFEVLFAGDTMMFSFSGKLLKKMRSNFFRKIEIVPEDIETIKARLKSVFALGIDMTRFLD